MKIYQIVGSLNFGDAIGNDVIAKKHVIEDMGIETEIYAAGIADKVTEPGAYLLDKMPKVKEDDIVIYHMGSGSPVNHMVTELNCRKIMFYHNITPYEFFSIDNVQSSENCRRGLEDMKNVMKGKFDAYLSASEFNKSNMIDMGYKAAQITPVPIIVPFEDYRKTPDEAMVQKLSDGYTNIIFVGRIAPNKKHEDIIRAFAYYKKNVNQKSRLILAGSHDADGMYYNDIVSYVSGLGVDDVVFPGHISFAEILAIYKTAHVFLCMSEHEGFCVPLLEAMTFDVPVIAYNACAVPETLGGAGVVVDSKDPVFLSKVIDGVVNNSEIRNTVIEAQRERLEDFRYEKIAEMFSNYLRDFMDKYPPLSHDDSRKNYDRLYNLTEENMKKSGNEMPFSKFALNTLASNQSENIDITALINSGCTPSEFIEAVFLSFFQVMPNESDYEYWLNDEKTRGREAFVNTLINYARESQSRIDKGVRLMYSPY